MSAPLRRHWKASGPELIRLKAPTAKVAVAGSVTDCGAGCTPIEGGNVGVMMMIQEKLALAAGRLPAAKSLLQSLAGSSDQLGSNVRMAAVQSRVHMIS